MLISQGTCPVFGRYISLSWNAVVEATEQPPPADPVDGSGSKSRHDSHRTRGAPGTDGLRHQPRDGSGQCAAAAVLPALYMARYEIKAPSEPLRREAAQRLLNRHEARRPGLFMAGTLV